MTSKIETIPLNKNIVNYTSDYILNLTKSIKFEDIAIIMPSKRPALFIKRELSKKIKKAFIPPAFFTFDNLIEQISLQLLNKTDISRIDGSYIIYNIVKKYIPDFYDNNASFAGFFEWANEILSFIEAADIEKISNKKLLNVKLNAEIGYDVTDDINELLKHLYLIREEFHKILDDTNQTTRGYSYYNAASVISNFFKQYKQIILFNPYYLNQSETDMFKILFKEEKLIVITKGNPENWQCLKKIYTDFNYPLPKVQNESRNSNINFYSAYDNQSQACLVKNLIAKLPKEELSDTVIILPDTTALPSIMSEIYSLTNDINIAVGYPANKTTLWALLNTLITTQKNKKQDGSYSTTDIVSTINNPLIKNIRFIGNPEVTRIIIHKIIKHFDKNNIDAKFRNYSFINLNLIRNNTEVLNEIISNLHDVSEDTIKKIIDEIFDLFFYRFANITTLKQLGIYLKDIADIITQKSLINTYSFNLGAVNLLYTLSAQLQESLCINEILSFNEILFLLENILSKENIALTGTPLKGLQVLGTLEARGLSFKNVFILSMSDNILPYTKPPSPLIPNDIMNFLGIKNISQYTNIQKFHFTSLIQSSINNYLIYIEDEQNSRSRFIEELIWDKQKEEKNIESVKVTKTILPAKFFSDEKHEIKKTDSVKQILKNLKYSATNIDTYLQCKLKFYYMSVLNLSQDNNFNEENENKEIGSFLHLFLEKAMKKGTKKQDLDDKFFQIYKQILETSFDERFKQNTGKNYLLKKLFIKKMTDFYKNEQSEKRNFEIITDNENKIYSFITVGNVKYNLTAKTDRIDKDINGKIYIIDYKSGKAGNIPNIKEPYKYSRENIAKNIKSFQLPLYKYIYENETGTTVENCMLYSLQEMELKPLFKNGLDNDLYNEYINQLKFIIEEINSDTPFRRESYDTFKCTLCPFFFLCN